MSYNGHKNYETWNVSLWIDNDEGLHSIAKECKDYREFINVVGIAASIDTNLHEAYSRIIGGTLDGISFSNTTLDIDSLDELIKGIV